MGSWGKRRYAWTMSLRFSFTLLPLALACLGCSPEECRGNCPNGLVEVDVGRAVASLVTSGPGCGEHTKLACDPEAGTDAYCSSVIVVPVAGVGSCDIAVTHADGSKTQVHVDVSKLTGCCSGYFGSVAPFDAGATD